MVLGRVAGSECTGLKGGHRVGASAVFPPANDLDLFEFLLCY